VRLLYHGRVDRRKGALDLLEALGLLRDRAVPFAATISGIGPDSQPCRDLAEALGLGSDLVRFTGYADYGSVPARYREADIFVSPTYAEGFSNTVLEAMASGLAILSCRAVGIVDCLHHGQDALLTEPGDVPELAAALERLIGDGELRRRLGAAALAECRTTYSWQAVAQTIMSVYGDLAGHPPDLSFSPDLPLTPCRFRAEPHLL
jgi:glycosyltransferase involved in cell wall biosynthesis